MHLLYVDMSGNTGGDESSNFVAGGVARKESGIFHVISELDDIVKCSPLKLPLDIELHGNEILRGKNFWRKLPSADRMTFYKQCLSVFHGRSRGNLKCFGIVLEKASLRGRDPVEVCFEQLCTRFNRYLNRLNMAAGSSGIKHKGLLVYDDSRYEGTLQAIALDYRVNGTKWGALRNLAEIPLFANSKASRLIQLADLVSYALWQRYERNEDQYFKSFVSAFDYHGSVYHGLYHQKSYPRRECLCPACMTRPMNRQRQNRQLAAASKVLTALAPAKNP